MTKERVGRHIMMMMRVIKIDVTKLFNFNFCKYYLVAYDIPLIFFFFFFFRLF